MLEYYDRSPQEGQRCQRNAPALESVEPEARLHRFRQALMMDADRLEQFDDARLGQSGKAQGRVEGDAVELEGPAGMDDKDVSVV